MSLEIVRIPALSDNYIWLLHDHGADKTAVVDPGEAAPVLAELGRRGWKLNAILNTHWHPDHTGGNAELKAATGATIIAPSGEGTRIPGADWLAGAGNKVKVGGHVADVLEVPGHTAGHIAYHFAEDGLLFVGDSIVEGFYWNRIGTLPLLNAGYSGIWAEALEPRVPLLLQSAEPAVAALLVGTNDAKKDCTESALDGVAEHFDRIVGHFHEAGVALVVVTPPEL